jgi:hypothetical protein
LLYPIRPIYTADSLISIELAEGAKLLLLLLLQLQLQALKVVDGSLASGSAAATTATGSCAHRL